jgi:twitching motility protein PilT
MEAGFTIDHRPVRFREDKMINESRCDHIISIEHPVEMVFRSKRCQITQREINLHTLSQASALRAALREDPDILVVSELRDLESIQLAVSAAETGHLVLGTMNTNNAAQTISRLIDSFPPEEQPIIRNMVSESLRGIISQQLIPRTDQPGVVPAYEVLVVNTAIANLIRKEKSQQVANTMSVGKADGMVLLDHSLLRLVNGGIISGQEAYMRAASQREFLSYAPKEKKEEGIPGPD